VRAEPEARCQRAEAIVRTGWVERGMRREGSTRESFLKGADEKAERGVRS
jgi:hypothetical protein